MKNVAIIYCGGISISEETKALEGVYNISTVLIDGEEVKLINEDITSEEFYNELRQGKRFKTSLPKLDMLEELFERLLKEYNEIIYITLSSELSGTFQSGVLLANEVSETRIKVFDSLTAIEGGELFVHSAQKLSQEGKNADEILKELETKRDKSIIYFKVDDIDYLVKGGRIGKAAGSVANFLSIKPVLTLNPNGFIDTFAKVRNSKKLEKKLIEVFDNFNINENSVFTIVHSYEDLTVANKFKEKLEERFPQATYRINYLSPIIGTHVGCNVIGICATNY